MTAHARPQTKSRSRPLWRIWPRRRRFPEAPDTCRCVRRSSSRTYATGRTTRPRRLVPRDLPAPASWRTSQPYHSHPAPNAARQTSWHPL